MEERQAGLYYATLWYEVPRVSALHEGKGDEERLRSGQTWCQTALWLQYDTKSLMALPFVILK